MCPHLPRVGDLVRAVDGRTGSASELHIFGFYADLPDGLTACEADHSSLALVFLADGRAGRYLRPWSILSWSPAETDDALKARDAWALSLAQGERFARFSSIHRRFPPMSSHDRIAVVSWRARMWQLSLEVPG